LGHTNPRLKKKSLGFFQELLRNRTPLPSMCAPGARLAAATGFLDEASAKRLSRKVHHGKGLK
jgi:hypothetical protein